MSRNNYIYKQVYIKKRRRALVDVTCVVEDVVVLVINRIKIQNKTSTRGGKSCCGRRTTVVVTKITEIISKIK
jgi:hypothetical protein